MTLFVTAVRVWKKLPRDNIFCNIENTPVDLLPYQCLQMYTNIRSPRHIIQQRKADQDGNNSPSFFFLSRMDSPPDTHPEIRSLQVREGMRGWGLAFETYPARVAKIKIKKKAVGSSTIQFLWRFYLLVCHRDAL